MHAHLFHNPNSGGGQHALDELEAVLRLAGYSVASFSVKEPDFQERLAEKCDLVVVAGGDGTVGKVLKLLPDRKIPVAILPLGTANNIATSLGITGTPEEIAQKWSPSRKKIITIGRVTGPWGEKAFVESVGFGAMVDATSSSVGKNKEGKSRLLLGRDAFRKAIKKAKARDMNVTVDGKELKGGLIALEIQNIGYAGPGLPLCLSADPADGWLDVVAIREAQREAMLAWVSPSEEQIAPPVTVVRGKKIVIRWNGKPPMRIDDKHIEAPDEKCTITIELEKKTVTVLVPPGTRAPRMKKTTTATVPKYVAQPKTAKPKASTTPTPPSKSAPAPKKAKSDAKPKRKAA